jgi:hypothetical protein
MRRKYANPDGMRDSVLSLMLRIKKHEQLFHGRGNHLIWERIVLKWNWISPDERIINSESHSSDCGLQSKTTLLILNDLQISIEITNQSGIHNTRAVVRIIPMVLLNQLINKVKRRNHNVGSEDISLNDHGFGFHPHPGGSYTIICPLPDPTLRAAA